MGAYRRCWRERIEARLIVHCLFVQMEKQKVKDKNEHSVQLATTKGRLVPEQKEVDEVENPLQQRERVAFLLKMYHEGNVV